MISSLHGLYDDRIYWKEAISLKNSGYNVTHLAVGKTDKDFISVHGIRLIQIGSRQYFRNPYYDKLYRIITFKPKIYQKILTVSAMLKADVYHFHDVQINKIGKRLRNLPHHPKVIYDVHEPYPEAFRFTPSSNFLTRFIHFVFSVYIRSWELRCSRQHDLVIATEENVADRFRDYLHKENKVEIIYNYTDLCPEQKDHSHENRTYDAIYTGSIRSTRGIFQVVQAVKMAKDKGYPFKVLFIGPVFEKNLNKKVFHLLEQYKLHEHIILKDPVPYEQISRFYEQSKVGLIIFSDNAVNRTILPIKLFEYMAYGLPVLSSNFGHMKKYTDMEETGLTVDPSNPHEICDKLISLLTNHELYKKCSVNGMNATNNKYRWQLMEEKLLAIYERLLN
jgi:glycosyltransferase involved in cell wall biosynthesis